MLFCATLVYGGVMPQRNTIKEYVPDAYYHVFSRGVNKQPIFMDGSDKRYFLKLLARYLSPVNEYNDRGVAYPSFALQVELVGFCLMGNHIHLLVHQIPDDGLKRFMSCLMTSYSMYFNLRHKRTGGLFESRYKAIIVETDTYLLHLSRYIHLNPRRWQGYTYSSITHYFDPNRPLWLKPDKVTSMFAGEEDYMNFVADYFEQHKINEEEKVSYADE